MRVTGGRFHLCSLKGTTRYLAQVHEFSILVIAVVPFSYVQMGSFLVSGVHVCLQTSIDSS
jgi:hypothetical protein